MAEIAQQWNIHEAKQVTCGKVGCHGQPMASTMVRGGPHGLAMVASAGLSPYFPLCCIVMFLLGWWYLTWFGHVGKFWASFAIFFDPLGLKNIF